MVHSSDDDDDFSLPSIANFNSMFSSVQQQARKEAASKVLPLPKPVSTKGSSKASKTPDDLKRKPKKSSSSVKKGASNRLEKEVKPDSLSPPPASDDLDDLIAQANKFIVPISKYASKNGGTSESLKSKTKGLSPTEDILASSSSSATVAAASSSSSSTGRGSRRTTRSKKSFPESVADLGTVVENGKRRSTRKSKKQVKQAEEVVVSSGDEGVIENMDVSLDVTLNESMTEVVEEEVINNNPLCTVRLRWKDEIIRLAVPDGTKISQIRMDVATKISVRADNLVILEEEGNSEVADNVLVENLPFGILEVFERQPTVLTCNNVKKMAMDPDCVQVKVQGCGGYRERLIVFIKKTTHIKQLVDDFVEKYGFQGKRFKLVFDGDDVDLSETAESLDLDGGEMFDIVEIK